MSPEILKSIIQKGEGIQVEFKTASFQLPKNVFDSVCAMLNRQGGHLFLGVTNKGIIQGVNEDAVVTLKSDFVTSVNNIAQLNPKYYLGIHDVVIEGKTILYTYIPESSQVHSYLGKIYDRNEDGDFDISNNPDLVRQLHFKKQGSFSENTIYPAITLKDLRSDLIQRCRMLAQNNKPGHLWMELNDEQMLRSANLWKKDWKTGEEGYTLASALLVGNDELIQHILPHYKTDALLQRVNVDRYDDREIIRTNLIESYDKLMAFIAKHLPDTFQMESNQRISVRDKLFREVIANTLIHREFMNEYPARLIITKNQVQIENWNRPHRSGRLRLDTFSPFPKNPVIAAFFREIGRAEELGSGYRNSERYTRLYSNGGLPVFEESDVFKTIIPVRVLESAVGQVIEGVNNQAEGVKSKFEGVNTQFEELNSEIERTFEGANASVKQKLKILLMHIIQSEGKRTPEYAELIGINLKSTERYIKQLRSSGYIEFKGDATKTGGYFITEKLKKIIHEKSAE